MPSPWLSSLASATSRRPSWFEVNAPQQSATPAPAEPVAQPLNAAWVNGQPVPLEEEPPAAEPPASSTPAWVTTLQQASQAAPAAPGATNAPSREPTIGAWKAPLSGLLGPTSMRAAGP
jgi:hypothetical protein